MKLRIIEWSRNDEKCYIVETKQFVFPWCNVMEDNVFTESIFCKEKWVRYFSDSPINSLETAREIMNAYEKAYCYFNPKITESKVVEEKEI